MKDIMTITLSEDAPSQTHGDEYTVGQQATIFFDEDGGVFGYRYHGVRYDGTFYASKDFTGFETKQAALKDAVENYTKGLGC